MTGWQSQRLRVLQHCLQRQHKHNETRSERPKVVAQCNVYAKVSVASRFNMLNVHGKNALHRRARPNDRTSWPQEAASSELREARAGLFWIQWGHC